MTMMMPSRTPLLSKAVQGTGGAQVAALLAGALK